MDKNDIGIIVLGEPGDFDVPEGIDVQYVKVEKSQPRVETKEYLGDSVYVSQGCYEGEYILTTENGFGPSNTIVMGPNEVQGFLNFVQRSQEMNKR